MNRSERVLEYIQRFGSITSFEAFQDLGITRLSAAIFEVKQNGYRITKKMETRKNRYGIPVTYARYSLGDANEV